MLSYAGMVAIALFSNGITLRVWWPRRLARSRLEDDGDCHSDAEAMLKAFRGIEAGAKMI